VRAVVLDGVRSVSVTDVADPVLPGDDGVVVQVEQAGICGSDLHLYHGDLGEPGTRLGHEFVGTVLEAGPAVRTVRPGDRVLVSGVIGCGHCPPCLARDPARCRNGGTAVFGTGADLPGGQAEAVAVIGLGPVGVLALECARLFGPARLFAVDQVPDRLARAERLGAETVDASAGPVPEQLMALTGGHGVDAVIEAVGADRTVSDALLSVATGGTVSVVGVSVNMAFPFPLVLALLRGLTFRVTLASIPSTWDTLVPLLATGRLAPDDVVTHRLGLSEAPEAYAMFDAHAEGVLKVVLDPTR